MSVFEQMLRTWLGSVALSLVALAPPAFAGESLIGELTNLQALRGPEYVEAREALLARDGIREVLANLQGEIEGCHLELLRQALLYRKERPEKAELLSKWWGQKVIVVPHGHITPGSVHSDPSYHAVIGIHFGAEAFPIVAENLRHVWAARGFPCSVMRASAIQAIMTLRDPRTPRVLLSVAADTQEAAAMRVHAIAALANCLRGLPAKRQKSPSRFIQLVAPRLAPEELSEYRADRLFPALEVAGEERRRVVEILAGLLEREESPHVRAASAFALQHAEDPRVIQALAKALAADHSPWVRAWCAAVLNTIGTDDAVAALAKAGQMERHGEVLDVIKGKKLPLEPSRGIPGHSIFEPQTRRHPGMDSLSRPPVPGRSTSR